MRDRAHRICDSEDNRWSEMEPLEGFLQANGFPSRLVKKTLSGQPRAKNNPDTEPQSLTHAPKLFRLPYVCGLSEKLQKIHAPLGVKAVFKFQATLRRSLVQVKSRLVYIQFAWDLHDVSVFTYLN